MVCSNEKGSGDCKKRNVTYRTECLRCSKETNGKLSQYLGESARTGFERGQEHLRDYLARKEDSHMFKHWQEDHPNDEMPPFSMKILRCHTSALTRQVQEAVLIEMNGENLLNSKGEYNRCQLPRLGVQMGTRSILDEEEVVEMTEEEIISSLTEDKKRKKKKENNEVNSQPKKKRKNRERIYSSRKFEPSTPAKRKLAETNLESNSNKKTRTSLAGQEQGSINPKSSPFTRKKPPTFLASSVKNKIKENQPKIDVFCVKKKKQSQPQAKNQSSNIKPFQFMNQNPSEILFNFLKPLLLPSLGDQVVRSIVKK